jgi:L-serine deaminase
VQQTSFGVQADSPPFPTDAVPFVPAEISSVIVNAINDGKRASTLSFLGLVFLPKVPWYRRMTRAQRRHQQASLLAPNLADPMLGSTQLPITLEVGGRAHALYRREHVIAAAQTSEAAWMYAMATATGRAPNSRRMAVPT